MLSYFGCNHENFNGDGDQSPAGTVWRDIWGVTWKKEYAEVMGLPVGNPLSEPDALRNYVWPSSDDERLTAPIYEAKKSYRNDCDMFLAGNHRDTLWEKSYMLVGMENMMEYFYTEPDYAREILHRIMDFQLGIAERYADCGIEAACLSDDLGTQNSLLLGPDLINRFLVPEYRRLFDFYKKRDIMIVFHSCGKIEQILDIFMELGVDVLNPVQATANNLRYVREVTQGRMALQGGVSSGLIMQGSPEQVELAVRDAILELGRNGGYFCAPDQGMPFPKENLEAFDRALQKYGSYEWIASN